MGAFFRRWERNQHNRDEEGAALTGRRIKPLFTWFSLCQIQEYRQVLLQKIRWCSAAVWRYVREKLSQCTRMGGHDWGKASNPRSKQKITWESQAFLEDAIVLLCWSTCQIGDRWSRLVRKDWLRVGSVSWHVVILVSSSVAGHVSTEPQMPLKGASGNKTSGFLTDKIRTPLEVNANVGNLRRSSSYTWGGV